MKKVVTTTTVNFALRTLRADDLGRVRAWFDQLANWDGDPHVRANSPELADMPGVCMFRTGTDARLFFTIDGDTVTVLDMAKKQAILATAG